jgi:hypothetical protein
MWVLTGSHMFGKVFVVELDVTGGEDSEEKLFLSALVLIERVKLRRTLASASWSQVIGMMSDFLEIQENMLIVKCGCG